MLCLMLCWESSSIGCKEISTSCIKQGQRGDEWTRTVMLRHGPTVTKCAPRESMSWKWMLGPDACGLALCHPAIVTSHAETIVCLHLHILRTLPLCSVLTTPSGTSSMRHCKGRTVRRRQAKTKRKSPQLVPTEVINVGCDGWPWLGPGLKRWVCQLGGVCLLVDASMYGYLPHGLRTPGLNHTGYCPLLSS